MYSHSEEELEPIVEALVGELDPVVAKLLHRNAQHLLVAASLAGQRIEQLACEFLGLLHT